MFVTLLPALLVSLGLQPNEDRAREFVNSISVTQAEQLYGILVDENFGNKSGGDSQRRDLVENDILLDKQW